MTTATKTGKQTSITRSGAMSRVSCHAAPRNLFQATDLNRRDDYGDLEALSIYIKFYVAANGGYMPEVFHGHLSADKQQIVLTDGFRRMAAYDQLMTDPAKYGVTDDQLTALQAAQFRVFVEKNADEVTILSRQIASNSGKPFTPYEQAKVLRDMEAAGLTRAEINQTTGLPLSTICERLKLLMLADDTAQFVSDNSISSTAALAATRQASKYAEPADQPDAADRMIRAAKTAADREGVSVSPAHIEAAAVEVVPQAISAMAQPLDKTELMARCTDFDNWQALSTSELRRVWTILKGASPSAELPQSKVAALATVYDNDQF